MIIGFKGRIGSGKTEATSFLMKERRYNAARFGDPVKSMISAYLHYRGVSDTLVHRMLYGDLKEVESPHLNGHTPRFTFQSLGDGFGRDLMGEDFWIEAVEARYHVALEPGRGRWIVEDVRRPNEAAFVRRHGGFIIGLTGGNPDRIVSDHASETETDLVVADVTLHNDFTPQFHRLVEATVIGFGG